MKKLFYIFLTIILLVPVLVNAHGDSVTPDGTEQNFGMMHEMSEFGMGGWWFWIMPFIFIIWSIVGVLLLIWLLKQLFKK